jgi:hypothetical protein
MLSEEQKKQILSDPKFSILMGKTPTPQTSLASTTASTMSFRDRANQLRSQKQEVVPEEKKEEEADKVNWFEKYFVNPTEKTADFLYGNFARAAGSVLTDATGITKNEMAKVGSEPSTLFFAALEVAPGGGAIIKTLKKVPGLGKVLNALGKVKGAAAAKIKQSAIDMMTKALKPTTNEMKAKTAKIVEEALERGVSGTASKIEAVSGSNKQRAWNNLDEALGLLPPDKKQSTVPIIKELAERQKQFMVDGVVVDKNSYEAINEVGDLILEFGDEIPSASLNKVRQLLDKMTYGAGKVYGKTLKEGTEANAQKELADIIRAEFAKENPDIAKLNKEYSFWATLNEVINKTIQRTKPQSGTSDAITAITAGAGLATGGLDTAIKAGLFTKYFQKLIASTYWKSVSAVQRNRIADLISSGKIEEAAYIAGRLYDGFVSKKEK